MTLQWRCFHCDEVFTDRPSAALHFGPSISSPPSCQVDMIEYRRMEIAHRAHCEEDTHLHRAIYTQRAEHEGQLKRAEEKGYARGLLDAQYSEIECMKSEAVVRANQMDLAAQSLDMHTMKNLSIACRKTAALLRRIAGVEKS